MRTCLACDTPIYGRVDKKYCDHNCRNAFHNERNRSNRKYVQSVNRNLAKNHRILEELIENEVVEVKVQLIKAMGFKPQFITSCEIDEKEGPLFFIYDYCYQQINEQIVIKIRELETYRNSA